MWIKKNPKQYSQEKDEGTWFPANWVFSATYFDVGITVDGGNLYLAPNKGKSRSLWTLRILHLFATWCISAKFFFQNIIIETFEFDVQLTQLTFCPAIPRICQWHSNLIMWLELQCGFYIYSLHETFQFGLFQIIVNIINTDYHYQKIFKTKFDIQSHIQWYWLSINIII